MGGGLAAVVGDRVTGQLEHVEEAETAEARLLPVDGEEGVVRLVRRVGGGRILVGAAQGQPRPRGQVVAGKGVVAPPVGLVRIVGQVVVLEAVDPVIVVQVDAEEELGTIDAIAEEGLVVVGDGVVRGGVVVLVEVGDEVVVLVPPRVDGPVPGRVETDPVRGAVLVVVVVDELVEIELGVVVDGVAFVVDQVGRGRVGAVDGIGFAEGEPGVLFPRQVDVPGVGRLRRDLVLLPQIEYLGIRILGVALVAVPLPVEVQAEETRPLHGEAAHEVGRGQPVVEADALQVRQVGHVALGPAQGEQGGPGLVDDLRGERRLGNALAGTLPVGPQLDLVVIGQDVVELDLDDRRGIDSRGRGEGRVVEVVVEDDALLAVGGEEAGARGAAEDDGPLAAGAHHVAQGVDRLRPRVEVPRRDAHIVAEEGGASLAVLGRVVAQDDGDRREGGRALPGGQVAGHGVAVEHVQDGVAVGGVHQGGAQEDEVAHLEGGAASEEGGEIRPPRRRGDTRQALGGALDRFADARRQDRGVVLVGGEIDLHTVEPGLGEGHRSQGGADAVSHGDGVGVLPLGVAADGDRVEPGVEAGGLEDAAALGLGLELPPVVDEPAVGGEVAVDVVEVVAFPVRSHVALVGLPGVVGVLPLAPAVIVVQLLRDVPLLDRRIEGPEEHPGALGREAHLPPALEAEPRSVVLLAEHRGAGQQRGGDGEKPDCPQARSS